MTKLEKSLQDPERTIDTMITETPTDGQEETAILLEEYEKRIATLRESLRQAGRIYSNKTPYCWWCCCWRCSFSFK